MEHNISHDTNDSILLKLDGTVPPLPAKMNAAHTPTPWEHYLEPGNGRFGIVTPDQEKRIAWIRHEDMKRDEQEANAAFIVRAVNSHDALMEALEELANAAHANYRTEFDAKAKARQALAVTRARDALAAARKEGAG